MGAKVALTFDDGPGPDTSRILEVLAAAGATATFFLVGSRIAARAQDVARIAHEGHEIGSHSWSHGYRRAPARLFAELVRTSLAVRRAAGVYPRWFRPPYAGATRGSARAARLLGMRTVTWDVDPRDWEAGDPPDVVERVLRSVRAGSIVLLHDRDRGIAVEALPSILDNLRSQGLATVTVSTLLADR